MQNNSADKPKAFMPGTIYIFTDGACKGNPGAGGYGIIFYLNRGKGMEPSIKKLSAGFKRTTNNRMELMAVIEALDHLQKKNKDRNKYRIVIASDSEYVVKAIKNKWLDRWIKKNWKTVNRKPVENQDLWKRLLLHLDKHHITFQWVKGHAGHEFNEECDRLASAAAEGPGLQEDAGYVNGTPSNSQPTLF